MAFSGLLALLDDVAAISDDVATLTYAATKKTTGLVTDDMAVTAEQAIGIKRERELPVVWKVSLGSIFNKAVILVPAALLLNWLAPWLLTPLLMAGGTYLCFEGVEKIVHKILHPKDHVKTHGEVPVGKQPKRKIKIDPIKLENQKVWGAIRTDFILSAEIIAISLGEVKEESIGLQIVVLYIIAIIMTVGVYGIVALLVKLDDIGEAMVTRGGGLVGLGKAILFGTPYLMKAISWIGTIAMLLVGGHIIMHGIPPLEHAVHDIIHGLHPPAVGEWALVTLTDFVLGLIVGGIVVGIMATGIPGAIWSAMPWVKDEEDGAEATGH